MSSKQEEIVEFLRAGTDEAESMSNKEVAARFGCNEGTVRRARKVIEAERIRDQAIEDGFDGGEALELLQAILAADGAEDEVGLAMADLKDELKYLKESLKDAREKAKEVRRSARERLPLFDRAGGGTGESPKLSLSHTG